MGAMNPVRALPQALRDGGSLDYCPTAVRSVCADGLGSDHAAEHGAERGSLGLSTDLDLELLRRLGRRRLGRRLVPHRRVLPRPVGCLRAGAGWERGV